MICGLLLYRSTDVSEVRINRLPPEPDCIALCYRPTGKAHGYRRVVLSLPSNFADPLHRVGQMLCKPPFCQFHPVIQVSAHRLGAVGFLSPLPISRHYCHRPATHPLAHVQEPLWGMKERWRIDLRSKYNHCFWLLALLSTWNANNLLSEVSLNKNKGYLFIYQRIMKW